MPSRPACPNRDKALPTATIEVTARTFGGFKVAVDGRPIGERDWKAANAAWLFLYLLLHEGEEIAQEKLSQLFWPASAPDKGHRALLTSVYRARQALGHRELIQRVNQAYRLGASCRLRLDVKDFVDCHRRVREDASSASPWVERMNELYEGPFVPECTDHWCGRVRQDLENLRLEVCRS